MSAPSPKSPSAPAPSSPTPTTPSPPPPAPAVPPTAPSPPPPAPASPPTSPPPKSPPPAVPPTASSPPPPVTPSPPPVAPPPNSPPASPPPPVAPNTPPSPPSPPPPSNPTPSNPSPTSHTPPSTPGSPPSPPSPPSDSNSVSIPLVAGVAVGGIVALLLVSLICVCCWKKKKRRTDEIPHYSGPPPPHGMYKDDPYARPYQQWQQPSDHVVKPVSDPSPPPPYPSRPPVPPPPPGQINSGGSGTNSNYSGGEALPPPSPGMAFGSSKSNFTYEELVIATDGFSDANLLGQGGFGYVHKGVLPNGKEIAVKQLKTGSGQGEREFQAEVEIISRVHHKHLVSLVGYCISGGQRLLVYEFVPNSTLEFHLHGKGRPTMEWSTRLRIALGAAKGLAYLHEDCHPKIIHRDIKASNILLDYKFEAKVADFGLAKFTEDNNTHVSTRVMGTFGYLAPEYASSGKLTEKSDVFSYGVMLLELITGRRPVDTTQAFMDDSLVDWARPIMSRAIEDGNYEPLVDPKLQKNYNPTEMARMIAVAAACVRHSAKRRPRMSQVVRALEGDSSIEDIDGGMRPGHSRYQGSYSSSEYDTSSYNEDMAKFRKMALQSSDYQSSQYSAPTSEYGLNPSGSSSEGQHTREMELGKMKKKDSSQFSSGGF
ncbi:hypothetical protein LUZ63_016499 [Rhynchospora breviuscula]|uniref:non-specific serine/threonine protein kinase n=1 Tax=Rhynchospora breviuscula TaxID=2022672 RepID=A0A9P9ZA10_9POAL|nr:hypothetical protein LUZ63_016499 [Rhynchospora breviuscula]